MLRSNYTSIEYQARTKLMDLAEQIAQTRKREVRDKLLDQAATIRYYLKAVELKTTYLDDSVVNNIYECLIEAAEINNFPTVPILADVATPDIGTTIIVQGTPGERGADGGGTDFESVSVSIDTVVDSFTVTDAYGARWDYVVYDGTNQRAGSISTTWKSDGSSIATPAHFSSADIGDTSGIDFDVNYLGGEIRLVATVTSGTWTVVGSRYFIPNSGAFQGVSGSSALADGKIFIGNTSNLAEAQSVTGDVTITNAGVTSIAAGSIVNADINGSAAIAASKLAALTASRAVVSDASGFLTTSTATSTEVGYLSGVTSSIQTQLDSKLSSTSGAISTVVNSNLTVDRAVISNASGKIAVSSVTSTELGYLSGVTSSVQTQLNGKVNDTGDTMTGALVNTSTIEAQGGIRTTNSGDYLKFKIIELGDWNMDSNASLNTVAHGVDATKIRSIRVKIIQDGGTNVGYDLTSDGIVGHDASNLLLSRTTSGFFDDIGFNDTSFNRGYAVIEYIV